MAEFDYSWGGEVGGDDDLISESTQHSLCKVCGQWYGWDEYHGSLSEQHFAVEMLRRQVPQWAIEKIAEGSLYS